MNIQPTSQQVDPLPDWARGRCALRCFAWAARTWARDASSATIDVPCEPVDNLDR